MKASIIIFIGLMLIVNSAKAEFPLTLRSVSGQAQLVSAGKKVPASPRRELNIGDELITEDGGEVEVGIDTFGHISVHANSKLSYRAMRGVESVGLEKPMPEVISGNACVQLDVGRDDDRELRIKLNPFFRAQLKRGHVCFERHGPDGVVQLVDGTVQIENRLNDSALVLSETGARYEVFGDGTGNLKLRDHALNALRDETSKPTIEHERLPVNDKTANAGGPTQPAAVSETDEADAASAIPEPEDFPKVSALGVESGGLHSVPQGKYVVYLFSARSLEEAEKVNRRLLKAGHNTRIFEVTGDGVQRFRVGLDGLASKAEAKRFSDSVEGKLGITETWITYGEDY